MPTPRSAGSSVDDLSSEAGLYGFKARLHYPVRAFLHGPTDNLFCFAKCSLPGKGKEGGVKRKMLSLKSQLINVQVRSFFCWLSSFPSQKNNHTASISQVLREQTYFISPW